MPLDCVTESRVVEVGVRVAVGGAGSAPAVLFHPYPPSYSKQGQLWAQTGLLWALPSYSLGTAQGWRLYTSSLGTLLHSCAAVLKGQNVFCRPNLNPCSSSRSLLCFIVPPRSVVQSLAPSSQGAAARSLQSCFFSRFYRSRSPGCASQGRCSRPAHPGVPLLNLSLFLGCFIDYIIYFSP